MTNLKIVNLVAGGTFTPAPDIGRLEASLEDAEIPGISTAPPWVGCRIGPRDTWFAFYKSGRFSMAGLRSMAEARKVLAEATKILAKAGQSAQASEIHILNTVLTAKIPLKRDLSWIYERLSWPESEYDPEMFPGMILKDAKASALVFSSGAVTLTGMRDEKQAVAFLERIQAAIQATGA